MTTMSASHDESHEVAIVEHAFCDEGAASDPAAIAHAVAACEDCLAYTVGLADQIFALHDRAHSRLGDASPPVIESLVRIDTLLDDVMVLMAHRSDTGSRETVGHGGRRTVPVGEE